MATPEQQARELLDRMGVEGWSWSAGDLVELANLIEERDRLRAGIDAALVEIADARLYAKDLAEKLQDTSARTNWIGVADGLSAAADIIRKHTGVTK